MQGVRSVAKTQLFVRGGKTSSQRAASVRGGVRSGRVAKSRSSAVVSTGYGVAGSALNVVPTVFSSGASSVCVLNGNPVVARHYHASASMKYAAAWEGVDKEVMTMPALSPSMESGNIASWVKKEGDKISPGDVIAEIETDKATVAFEATEPGFLAKILKPSGAKNIAVGEPVAIVVAKKELVSKFTNYVHSDAPATNAAASPAASAPVSAPVSTPSPKKAAPAAKSIPSVPHSVLPMPSLSPTMEDGVIVAWKKQEGEKISAGDVLAEVETDKATVAFEATEDGYLAKILVQAGPTRIKVNVPVAIVVDKKADIPAVKDYHPTAAGLEETEASESAAAPAAPVAATAAPVVETVAPVASGGRVIASPYAKLLSKEKSVPLAEVAGTGPGGRVVARDVLNYVPKAAAAPTSAKAAPSAKASVAAASEGYFDDLSVSNIRRVTAERLTQSKTTIPHYYLTMDVEVDELLKVREELNSAAKGEYKLSVNDFVVKASAMAMKKVPQVNSQWMGEVIRQFHNVDINVAVSTDTGLLTPIVRDADLHGLVKIASTIKQSAQNAKDGKISPAELAIGTFTISNLGMFGIDHFSAVILPPQACILAVGASKARVVPNPTPTTEKPFLVKNYMAVTLSCDHRVVDGAVGAKWLQAFKDLIENPMKLLL